MSFTTLLPASAIDTSLDGEAEMVFQKFHGVDCGFFLTKGEIELVQKHSDSETFCTTDDGVVDDRCKEDENVVGHGDVVDNLVHFSSFQWGSITGHVHSA